MKLHAWQTSFLHASVLGSDGVLDAIKPSGNLDRVEALSIYQNNCLGSRINALVDIYSTCVKILGEDYFRQLARDFALSHPAASIDLNKYGGDFPRYLETQLQQRQELQEYDYLADLVALDFQLHILHAVGDSIESDSALLSRADELLFSLCSACVLLKFDYPVDRVWQVNQSTECSSDAVIEEYDVAPYTIMLQRRQLGTLHYDMVVQRISAKEYQVLDLIKRTTMENLLDQADSAGDIIPERFPHWIQQGWLSWELGNA